MERRLPFVSVIIPVLDGERTIRDCVVSLLKMDYPVERREILVVDNGSTDSTAEIVKSFPVRYLQEERRGASHARNRGIEASNGEILAFTDADCVVTTEWLLELVQGFENQEVGGVEGEIITYPPATPVEQHLARTGSHSARVRMNRGFFPCANTANVAFRREVFHQVGSFDTRFPAAGVEDIDFSWRFLEETGLKLHYNPKAVIFHRHRNTVRGYFYQQMIYGRGFAILQAKYPVKLSWGWRKELQAWGAVAQSVWIAIRAALRCGLLGGDKVEAYDSYLTSLKKLAVRVGFLWGTFRRGSGHG